MLIIGLTGSIATGKSTVAKILSAPPHSLPLIDADVLARDAVRPGTRAYAAILKHFSSTTPDLLLPLPESSPQSESESNESASSKILTQDPSHPNKNPASRGRPLNRAALGRRVFGSTPSRLRARATLNDIVHPAVRRLMLTAVLRYYVQGHWAVVLDIPLLFESGLDIFCGAVLMVAVTDPVAQMRRLRLRDPALSQLEAEERVGSQMPVGEKVERCEARGRRGSVVLNVGTMDELRENVARAMEQLERSKRWRLWLWLSPFVAGALAAWEVWKGWRARKKWESGAVAKARDGNMARAEEKNEKRE